MPQHNPCYLYKWCLTIVIAIIKILVIVACIVTVVEYKILHPRVPSIHVGDATLEVLKYDIAGVLQAQLSVTISVKNKNAKVPAFIDETAFKVSYEGKVVSILREPDFKIEKEDTMSLPFVVRPYPIRLTPSMVKATEYAFKQDVIKFEIKGGSKTRFRVGPLGLLTFKSNLSCELRFSTSNHTYIPSPCT